MPAIDLAELDSQVAPANGEEAAPIKPLTVWRPSQFLEWTEPPGNHLILPAYLTKGQLTTLIGQGGLGKSRLSLWQAVCQVLHRPWCGLETGGDPAKWLFLGDENVIPRLKEDLSRILSILTADEIARVDDFLRLQALVELDDYDVWLGDLRTQARIAATIQAEQPDALVVDPLGNFAPGDTSKPGDMKEAIRLLLGIVRRAAPKAAIQLLHHARTGRQNIAQGIGWDAANFASGGKALFATARCQMNLMPGSADDDTRLVLSCAKSNNCKRFETRGLIFDPQVSTYSVDPNFDADTWHAEVEGRACSGQSLCTVADVVSAVRDGYVTTRALVEHFEATYAASKRTAERLISRTLKAGGIGQLQRGRYILGPKAEKLSPPTT